MEKKHVIEAKNLTKCYKNGKKALDNFNIQVQKGEMFALLGPNGAGKSTLLDTLSMIKYPTSGTISMLRQTISKNVSIFKRGLKKEEEEAEYLADTLCIMAKGRNIIQGSLAEIKNQLGPKDINALYPALTKSTKEANQWRFQVSG